LTTDGSGAKPGIIGLIVFDMAGSRDEEAGKAEKSEIGTLAGSIPPASGKTFKYRPALHERGFIEV
jgi:hypothetical protein